MYAEPVLPLNFKSSLQIALEQIVNGVTAWLVKYAGAEAVPHPGVVDRKFLEQQSGRSIRCVIAHDRGSVTRLAGGKQTNVEPRWLWFLVIPGTIQNRAVEATGIVGEALKYITAHPWSDFVDTAATGTVQFTGTDGAAVPLGQLLTDNDDEKYVTTAAGVIAGGVVDLPTSAVEVGAEGNSRTARVALTVDTPPAGVDPNATALQPGFSGGAWDTAFIKTPKAGTINYKSMYKTGDEKLAQTVWMLSWEQPVNLGTARRARTPGPEPLLQVLIESTIPSTPNDDEFTQIIE